MVNEAKETTMTNYKPIANSQDYWPIGAVRQSAAVCPCCKKPDLLWGGDELRRGKRGLLSGEPGVEYHCLQAYYELQ